MTDGEIRLQRRLELGRRWDRARRVQNRQGPRHPDLHRRLLAPPNGISLLKYCATSSSDYYQAKSMDDLVKAFSSIAQTATQSITMLTK
jgi:hypothetical protein